MLSYELLQDIQEYIKSHFTEDLPSSTTGEDAVTFWNEHTEDKHKLEIPEFLDEDAQLKDLTIDASAVCGSHYNPDNDFPIPEFLKISIDAKPILKETDAAYGEQNDKEKPKHKARMRKETRSPGMFSALKSLSAIEDFEDNILADECLGAVSEQKLMPSLDKSCSIEDLKEKFATIDEGFGEMLLKKIDALGITDADCYKKAQLNRSHFNRIKNDPEYHIQKETIFALALALSLNKKETDEFLKKAGYAFSPNSKADLIVEYCIMKSIYDVTEVNQLLYAFDQKLLGAGIRE